MTQNKDKIKFLQVIKDLRSAYETILLPKNLSRTVSFRIFPKGEDREILDKWFEEISEIKYLHLKDLYEEFKAGELNLFINKKLGYDWIYKNKKRFEKFKNTYKILTSKVEEGIRTEISSVLNSFVTNTQKAFYDNKRLVGKILERKDLDDSEKTLIQGLIEEYKKLSIQNYETWQTAKNLTEEFNTLIAEINKERNLKKKRPISNLKRLPSFPLIEKYQNLDDFKNRNNLEFNIKKVKEEFKDRLKYLLNSFEDRYNLKKERIDIKQQEDVISKYLQEKGEQLLKKLKYRKKKSSALKDRFLYWYITKRSSESIENIIKALFNKLEKQKKHLFKKPFDWQGRNKFFNTLFFLTEILYVSSLPEEKRGETLNEINNEITKIKAEFLKGKPVKDSFIISGFGWKDNKPLKAGALILKIDKDNQKEKHQLGITLGISTKAFCLKNDHNKDFYFIVLTGGSRKKSQRKPKEYKLISGHLEKDKDPYSCYFWLYHGKSYLRRILFHKEWGFLSESKNKFFPANARVKRVKNKPGDKFEYYVDITFEYNGDITNIIEDSIKNKISYVLGIDRGEKYPIAYAVLDKDKKVVGNEKGILGKEFAEKLEELHKKRKKKKIGNRILRTQETILHQSISKILKILSNYPAIIVMENLRKGFGKEEKIIAKRVYRKIEKFLELALQYANLPKKYLLKFVDPKDTSIICPNCEFNFNADIKRKILDGLTLKQFENLIKEKSIDLDNKKFLIGSLQINLPEHWVCYLNKYPKNIKLDEIKELIEQNNLKEALEYFKTVTPRISRDKFKCLKCGYEEEADVVGAINIARKYDF
ncbi:CRISPR-associated endonuclease Cpf1 [bacterium HR35]|nr:CRISPR-associated endonuclease Cpf1 [bacterium HR35]